MSEIMLIRRFENPIGAEYLHQATIALGWCRTLYGVNPSLHFLATDGLRCACIFDAPDAEAVRSVIRSGGRSEPEALWPCTVHPGPDDDGAGVPLEGDLRRTLVLVERAFDHPSRHDEPHTHGALPTGPGGMHFVRSFVSHDRLRAICIYAAQDLESVREAHQRAGLEFERMWSARAIHGAPSQAMAQSC